VVATGMVVGTGAPIFERLSKISWIFVVSETTVSLGWGDFTILGFYLDKTNIQRCCLKCRTILKSRIFKTYSLLLKFLVNRLHNPDLLLLACSWVQ
jgi:hypothetical protein